MKALKIFLFMLLISQQSFSQQVSIVFDRRAVGQVGANSVSAIAKETLIKESFSKAKKAQETIGKYVAIVQLNLDKIEKAKQDVSAFREGTYNIKVLTKYLVACLDELKGLATDIPKYPFGTIAYSKQIRNITEHIIDIGVQVSHCVTDGQVQIQGVPTTSKVYNLIDPVNRLEIINRCIYDLQRVYSLIRDIRLNLYIRNTVRDASETAFPIAVVSYDRLKEIKKEVKQLWYE